MGRLERAAAPAGTQPQPAADELRCPWCGAEAVERLSVYGPLHMAEQWFCNACRSPYERVRKRGS